MAAIGRRYAVGVVWNGDRTGTWFVWGVCLSLRGEVDGLREWEYLVSRMDLGMMEDVHRDIPPAARGDSFQQGTRRRETEVFWHAIA